MARTSKGEIQPDPTRFPPTAAGANDGMTAVIAYVHSKNLSFGLYTAGGTAGCMKSRAGSRGHWVQDAKSFAAWGVDYVKMDWCGGEDVHGSYGNMSKALNATGVSRSPTGQAVISGPTRTWCQQYLLLRMPRVLTVLLLE